ncbi:MAG TPA: hypothetical protein PKX48_14460 [Planctomycetota bacterium]|jgi:hypothetical protein|nr:hypothetical protein [Planctomycetota bacterium]OQC19331.1 MAG: hypothetical protein BWX69_02829 [Planctomycetes bacterium ADurb.Bin069]HNS00409.1 hypothetical protein [Planctomycetota bacterium]HNU26986.1 hypothetical protein [Planctomycetota bacterium]HOE31331.1 hypothetical protein [Planctomycetota bacterium]
MPADPARIILLTRIAGVAAAAAAAACVALALLFPFADPRARTRIVLLAEEVRPAWHVIAWGASAAPGDGGLRIAPLAPGSAWAGVRLQRVRKEAARDAGRPALTAEWLTRGVLAFALRGGEDATGAAHPPPQLQIFLHTGPRDIAGHAVRLRPRNFLPDGGDGWRRARVPLSHFEAPPQTPLFGLAFQVVGELNHAFVLRDVELLLGADDGAPPAAPEGAEPDFAALIELPPSFREPPPEPPAFTHGAFRRGGAPVFLLGTQLSYDPRHDLWGDTLAPPSAGGERWEGCDPALAWLYESLPSRQLFARLGFNSWIVTAPPQPFLEARRAPIPPVLSAFDAAELPRIARGIALPLTVDHTLFDWAMETVRAGAAVPPGALAPAGRHYLPFALEGAGRDLYLEYFARTAAFLKENAIPVFQFELFNEPDYPLPTEAAPPAAGARSAGALAAFGAGCARLRGSFLDLVDAAVENIRAAYGPALFAVQLNRNDVVEGTPLIDPEALFARLTAVTAPTDGGIWTFGSGAAAPPAHAVEAPLAPAPLTADLLRAFAGAAKPILDHEMTCPGEPEALLRALWTRVLLGFDGASLFQWSKRAWQWHTAEEGARLAARYEFCLLNPHAHPPAELAAIMRFRRELAPHEELLLPKPFGVAPAAAYVHSYANELAHRLFPTDRLLGRAAYAALAYTHVPLQVLTEAMFRAAAGGGQAASTPPIRACVLGGATCLERATAPALEAYARSGGVVFLVNAAVRYDASGAPLDLAALAGAAYGDEDPAEVVLPDVPECGLPGALAGRAFRTLVPAGARVVFRDSRGDCRAACRQVGAGKVYTIAFDGRGLALLRLLRALLAAEGIAPPWSLTTTAGEHAANVLVSVRDRGARKAILLANQDDYPKDLWWRWPGLGAGWRARLFLEGERGEPRVFGDEGAVFALPARGVKLLVLARGEEAR